QLSPTRRITAAIVADHERCPTPVRHRVYQGPYSSFAEQADRNADRASETDRPCVVHIDSVARLLCAEHDRFDGHYEIRLERLAGGLDLGHSDQEFCLFR